GVAPPVSDDCAPIGSTLAADRRTAATSPSLAGDAIPAAWPPGKCAASSRNFLTTSGSLRISPATISSLRGRLARREWPDIREQRTGREGPTSAKNAKAAKAAKHESHMFCALFAFFAVIVDWRAF